MESKIAKAIHLEYHPVALLWSNEKPEGAMQFQEKKWGCVMWLAASAAKGKPAGCDIKSWVFGGGVGLVGKPIRNFPGGRGISILSTKCIERRRLEVAEK